MQSFGKHLQHSLVHKELDELNVFTDALGLSKSSGQGSKHVVVSFVSRVNNC